MRPIRVDFTNNEIIMTKRFADAASNPYSNEAEILRETKAAFPTFRVRKHTIRQKTTRECYNGLTYDYMREYIATHDEEAEAALAELEEMIILSKCHSKRYPTIKKWFLNKYEEVKLYGVEVLETSEKVVEARNFEEAA